jgi:hypothetical protein
MSVVEKNVDFEVAFLSKGGKTADIYPKTRLESSDTNHAMKYVAPGNGKIIYTWNNTFSTFTSKTVTFTASNDDAFAAQSRSP